MVPAQCPFSGYECNWVAVESICPLGDGTVLGTLAHFPLSTTSSLRKQPTFRDATTGTPPPHPREMTSEKRPQKFHTDDALLPGSG